MRPRPARRLTAISPRSYRLGDFDRRIAAHMADPANQSDFWKERPDMAEQFARHAVRAEIAKGDDTPDV